MSKILLENENLTADDLLPRLQDAFDGRCRVSWSRYPAVLIAVRESAWCGIAVRRVRAVPGGTEVVFNPFVPSFLANMLLGGLFLALFLRGRSRLLMREFEHAVQGATAAAETPRVTARESVGERPANPLRDAGRLAAVAAVVHSLPSLMYGFWYFPPIVAGVVVTSVTAFLASFVLPGGASSTPRGISVALLSGVAGLLGAAALAGGSLAWEVSRWTTPLGLVQLGVFAAVGLLAARRKTVAGPGPVEVGV